MNEHPYWNITKLINVVEMSWPEFVAAMSPLNELGVDLNKLVLREPEMKFFIEDDYVKHEGPPPTSWTMADVIADNYRPAWFTPCMLKEIMTAATCFGLIPNRNYLVVF